MFMATTAGAETVDLPIWDIKHDIFTLPPTRRLRRGWDRAPVAARAPRLHGRKVWKKVSARGKTIDDVSNEVQEELQREGAGARKKSKMMGARENIGNAIWKDKTPDTCAIGVGNSVLHDRDENIPMVPTKDGLENGTQGPQVRPIPVATMPELHFVPRKRTNTNHVITPRDKMRQTTLDQQVQPLAERVNGSSSPTKRPRKSIRKSWLAGKVENDIQQKPVRPNRRDSSNFDSSFPNEHANPNDQVLKSNIIEVSGTRRSSRRTTATTRHSILHVELPIEPQNTELQGTMRIPTDVLTTPAPEPSNATTSVDIITASLLETTCLKISSSESDFETSTAALPNMELPNDSEQSQPHTGGASELSAVTADPEHIPGIRPSIPIDTCGINGHVQNVTKKIPPPQQITILSQATEISEQQETPRDIARLNEEFVGHSCLIEDCGTCIEKQASSVLDEGTFTQNVDELSSLMSEGCSSLALNNAYLESDGVSTVQASSEAVTYHGNDEEVEQSHNTHPDTNSSNDTPLSSSTTSNYDHDDTDMLRNFLTRVKANKAARKSPRRKRSLPHSPLRLPLGTLDNNLSPSPLRQTGESETTEPSPMKGKRKGSGLRQEGVDLESRSIRRSGRTRLPVKEPPAVPSFIPVRRLGQDLDNTITLKRSEEKELAALTRVNTRKNKGNSLSATEVLTRKAEEKEDPVMRQRLLKEVFEEKMEKSKQNKDKKGRDKKVVSWAEEIAQFQNLTKGKVEVAQDDQEKEKSLVVQGGEDKKSSAVRVGVRSKGALGGALNGTPAPKRKMRGAMV